MIRRPRLALWSVCAITLLTVGCQQPNKNTIAQVDPYVGGVHYLNLSYLMPQVIAGLRSLIQLYEKLGPTGSAEADGLVSRLLSDHKRHLAELEKMHSNLAPAAR